MLLQMSLQSCSDHGGNFSMVVFLLFLPLTDETKTHLWFQCKKNNPRSEALVYVAEQPVFTSLLLALL